MITPAEAARRWKTGLSQAGEKVKAGVNGVTESPMEKAAQRADKYQQGVMDAVTSGRFQAGLRSVSLDEWKRTMVDKGVQRMASGAQMAEPKMQAFMTKFLPEVERIKTEVNAMPDNTFEERVQKMLANANKLHQLKGMFK